jgi:hypothetical protein
MNHLSPVTDLFAKASFIDTLTLTGGTGQGFAQFGLKLDGNGTDSTQLSGFNGPVGQSSVKYTIDLLSKAPSARFSGTIDVTNQGINTQVQSQPIPFTFGIATPVYFELQTQARVFCFAGNIGLITCDPGNPGDSGTDFLHTAVLNSIVVTDSVGNPVTNFQITSASGTPYTSHGVVSDTTPPVTTAVSSPPPNSFGWNNSNVSVTLSAVDEIGGSGVKQISYVLTGAQTGSAVVVGNTTSVSISAEGIITVTYFATDNAGNQETAKTLTVRIDKTPPAISLTPAMQTLWPPNGNLVADVMSGNLTDALSGVDPSTVRFSVIDEYGLVQPSGPVTLLPNGAFSFSVMLEASRRGQDRDGRQYQIIVTGSDKAGNQASTSTSVTVPHDQGR